MRRLQRLQIPCSRLAGRDQRGGRSVLPRTDAVKGLRPRLQRCATSFVQGPRLYMQHVRWMPDNFNPPDFNPTRSSSPPAQHYKHYRTIIILVFVVFLYLSLSLSPSLSLSRSLLFSLSLSLALSLSLSLSLCVHTYIYTHTDIHSICIYTCMYACICIFVYVGAWVYIYIYTCTWMFVYLFVWLSVCQ